MQLTRSQFRALRYYLDHWDHSPTLLEFFWRFGRVLIIWTLFAVVGSYYCLQIERPQYAWLLSGVFLGSGLREFRGWIWGRQIWPAIRAVTDRDRVEDLVNPTGDGEHLRSVDA